MPAFSRPIIAGIFVGGASARMGGKPKGLLVLPSGETIVARWRRIFASVGIPCVLVGEQEAYAAEGLEIVADAVDAERPRREGGDGPLAGLVALLARAGNGDAIAVACDMPHVSEGLVRKLAAARPALLDPASPASPAPAIAARRDDRWEPFFARYDAPAARAVAEAQLAAGRTSLQHLLDALGADELPLTADEARELRDWDTPADLLASDP